jgi:hypothetical protein
VPHEPLDRFETALLGELRAHVAATHGRAPARRPPLLALAAGAVVLAGGTTALTLLPNQSPPAFAIGGGAGGDVVVRIARLEDDKGLERALAAVGVDSVVRYDPTLSPDDLTPGSLDVSDWKEGSLPARECEIVSTMGRDGLSWRLTRAAVESDAVLHITLGGSLAGPESFQLIGWEGC